MLRGPARSNDSIRTCADGTENRPSESQSVEWKAECIRAASTLKMKKRQSGSPPKVPEIQGTHRRGGSHSALHFWSGVDAIRQPTFECHRQVRESQSQSKASSPGSQPQSSTRTAASADSDRWRTVPGCAQERTRERMLDSVAAPR